MLLALDVGNTNLTAGLFSGRRLDLVSRLDTPVAFDQAKLRRFLFRAGRRADAVVVGSVVPALTPKIVKAVRASFGIESVIVTPASDLGIKLRVKKPAQVGADRILNALAAHSLARGAAIVVDFGTATTFDCVSARGDYLGGAILLGPNTAAAALHEKTAQLPLVRVRRPRRAVGKDTVECIEAGLYFGYLGMIKEVLRLSLTELGGRPRVLATGGLARLFAKDLPRGIEVVPDLTLQGLRIAHERISYA